ANNHVLDSGQQGYDDTKAAVDAVGIAYAGRDEWTIYETPRGLKIGVYAVSFGSTAQITAGVKAVKEAGADFVIAALHWGDEGSYQVNADQLACGHAAVDAGANFVYGSHPHTLQPIERYNGVEILYSMGNWTFGGNTNPRDKDTFIYELTVAQYPDGRCEIADTRIIPCASSGVVDGNNYQPVPYEEGSEEYARVLSKLDGSFEGQNLSIGYSYGPNE
ncbi:MAG: CapA family protein, partial [Oscillospiraceae bacterium]|nr:CapA family protein [Oscillospiraceae bacterium]